MKCFNCSQTIPPASPESLTLEYALYQGQKICLSCCAEMDARVLRETGRLRGYIERSVDGRYLFRNFNGSFSLPISRRKVGNARINETKLRKTDFWGVFEGREFHGVQIGGTLATIKLKK